MRAILCRNPGPIDELILSDLPVPAPGPGEVRVRLRAAALNFMDTLIVQGRYQLKPPLPFVPGAEMAGEVAELGGGVAGLELGQPVIVRGSYGCLAEEVLAARGSVLPIDPPSDWGAVAALSLTYTTAYHALVHRAGLVHGETVLVLGAAGGVGTAAIQVAKALGARVVAACSGAKRAALCLENGADAAIDYSSPDFRDRLREVSGGAGLQAVLDLVGGPYTEPALRSIGSEGRYLVVGFASGDIPRIPAQLLLLKGAVAIGVNADFSRRDAGLYREVMNLLLAWLAEGRIRPVIGATYSLDDAVVALHRLADRAVEGKVVIVP